MNYINKISVILMYLLIIIATHFSCKKAETIFPLNKHLPGSWTFTSMKLDGTEYLGNIVSFGKILFKPAINDKGEFKQEIAFTGSYTDIMTGEYILDEGKKEVVLQTAEKMITINMTIINHNEFLWESQQDGKAMVVKAKRD
jgi:hypothetical protein